MRICVIFNPAARGDKARRFRRHLNEFAADNAVKQTAAIGDARKLAAEAVKEGFEIVVAAGGDGTVNEVLNGIGDAPDGFQRARLGVLPLGTVNVFARELGISFRLESAWKTIREGNDAPIDLPSVEYSAGGGRARRYFAQLAGAGLDARAIELVHWPLKKRIGPLAYVVAGLRAVSQHRPGLTFSDGRHTAAGELIVVGNGRLYGGPFAIFPQADLRDGVMDIRILPRVNWLTLIRIAPSVLFRRHLPLSAAESFRSASFTLSSASPVPLEVDGEMVGHLPAQFSIQPSRLRVRTP